MDLTPTTKSPETESTETATRIHPAKHLTFTNGVLKRHHHHGHHHGHHHPHHPIVVTYKECLKNHAASLGGHALDGCGEFMPSPTATSTDPTSLKCAACGCHRNFHRREPDDQPFSALATTNAANTTATIEYQPHHRHHPPPPPQQAQQPSHRSPNSSSPPPISSSYYPSAPHMLLALSGGLQSGPENVMNNAHVGTNARKRYRTKFSQTQKEKMFQFAEKVGWKMQKRDEEIVQEFCNEVGVDRTVLKVWMHNNKNTFGKRDGTTANGSGSAVGSERINLDNTHNNESNENNGEEEENNNEDDNNNNSIIGQNLNHQFESESVGGAGGAAAANANGSSSSS